MKRNLRTFSTFVLAFLLHKGAEAIKKIILVSLSLIICCYKIFYVLIKYHFIEEHSGIEFVPEFRLPCPSLQMPHHNGIT